MIAVSNLDSTEKVSGPTFAVKKGGGVRTFSNIFGEQLLGLHDMHPSGTKLVEKLTKMGFQN